MQTVRFCSGLWHPSARSGRVLTPVYSLLALLTGSGFTGLDELLYHILQLLAEENGDNCRRRLVCSQSVVISDVGRRTDEAGLHEYQQP